MICWRVCYKSKIDNKTYNNINPLFEIFIEAAKECNKFNQLVELSYLVNRKMDCTNNKIYGDKTPIHKIFTILNCSPVQYDIAKKLINEIRNGVITIKEASSLLNYVTRKILSSKKHDISYFKCMFKFIDSITLNNLNNAEVNIMINTVKKYSSIFSKHINPNEINFIYNKIYNLYISKINLFNNSLNLSKEKCINNNLNIQNYKTHANYLSTSNNTSYNSKKRKLDNYNIINIPDPKRQRIQNAFKDDDYNNNSRAYSNNSNQINSINDLNHNNIQSSNSVNYYNNIHTGNGVVINNNPHIITTNYNSPFRSFKIGNNLNSYNPNILFPLENKPIINHTNNLNSYNPNILFPLENNLINNSGFIYSNNNNINNSNIINLPYSLIAPLKNNLYLTNL